MQSSQKSVSGFSNNSMNKDDDALMSNDETKLVNEMKGMANKILNRVRETNDHLFSYAQAKPLINEDYTTINLRHFSQKKNSRDAISKVILQRRKAVMLNADNKLTKDFLIQMVNEGSRVLILKSYVYEENYLVCEDEFGMA